MVIQVVAGPPKKSSILKKSTIKCELKTVLHYLMPFIQVCKGNVVKQREMRNLKGPAALGTSWVHSGKVAQEELVYK